MTKQKGPSKPPTDPSIVEVEMDAMDEAEWERDKHTPQVEQAQLSKLVKEAAQTEPAKPRGRTPTRPPPTPAAKRTGANVVSKPAAPADPSKTTGPTAAVPARATTAGSGPSKMSPTAFANVGAKQPTKQDDPVKPLPSLTKLISGDSSSRTPVPVETKDKPSASMQALKDAAAVPVTTKDRTSASIEALKDAAAVSKPALAPGASASRVAASNADASSSRIAAPKPSDASSSRIATPKPSDASSSRLAAPQRSDASSSRVVAEQPNDPSARTDATPPPIVVRSDATPSDPTGSRKLPLPAPRPGARTGAPPPRPATAPARPATAPRAGSFAFAPSGDSSARIAADPASSPNDHDAATVIVSPSADAATIAAPIEPTGEGARFSDSAPAAAATAASTTGAADVVVAPSPVVPPSRDRTPSAVAAPAFRADSTRDSEADIARARPIVEGGMFGALLGNKRLVIAAGAGLLFFVVVLMLALGGSDDKPKADTRAAKAQSERAPKPAAGDEPAAAPLATNEPVAAPPADEPAVADDPAPTGDTPAANDVTAPSDTPSAPTAVAATSDTTNDTAAATTTTPPPPPAAEPAPVRKPRTLGGKQVVVEYDTQAREAKPVPNAPKDDQAAISKARTFYAAGNTRLFAGDADGAIQNYRQALAHYPAYVAGYRGLGLAYAQKGDKQNAVKALRTYVNAAPSAKDASLIKKRIQVLSTK